jgi:hypothetical protein
MTTPLELAERKARLIAQSELDRMRLTHAVLGVRQSISPALGFLGFLGVGGGGVPIWRSLAFKALAFAVPLFGATRTRGLLRVVAVSLGVVRALRRFVK